MMDPQMGLTQQAGINRDGVEGIKGLDQQAGPNCESDQLIGMAQTEGRQAQQAGGELGSIESINSGPQVQPKVMPLQQGPLGEEFKEASEEFEEEPEEEIFEEDYTDGPDPDDIAMELDPDLSTGGYCSSDEYPEMQYDPRDPCDSIDIDMYCLQVEFGLIGNNNQGGQVEANQQEQPEEEVEIREGDQSPLLLEPAIEEDNGPEASLRRSKRILDRGGGPSYAQPKKTTKKRKDLHPADKKVKEAEKEDLLKALADEALMTKPLDEGIKTRVKEYCGVKTIEGMEAGQGSAGAALTKEGYKYNESALDALEYNSEEKLSDDESINLAE